MTSVVKAVLFGVMVAAICLFIAQVSLGLVTTTTDYFRADLDARTQGTIEESAKVYARSGRYVSGHYRYRVRYSYEVGGMRYTSTQVNYSLPNTEPEAVVARYPVGKEVAVYYDSARPTLSVLEPGKLDSDVWELWAVLLAVLIGTPALLIYLPRGLR